MNIVISGKEISDVVVPENICLQCWVCLTGVEKKVGTEFTHETAASVSNDDSSCSVIVIQI